MTIRRTLRVGTRCRCGLPWSRPEIDLLSQLYADHSDGELGVTLGRSEWAVRGKARALGLVRDPEEYPGYHAARDSRPWSPAEVDLLQRLHKTSPYEEIADLIGRTRNAVHLKARKLGLRKMEFWDEAENAFLKERYKSLSYGEVGQLLGRSSSAVNARVTALGLSRKSRRWTQEELRVLEQDYARVPPERMSAVLGRTQGALMEKACREGAHRKPRWSELEDERLRELQRSCTVHEISQLMGRSQDAIRRRIRQLRTDEQPVHR